MAEHAAPVPGDRHSLSMTVLMTPDMANFSGDVHGGSILKLLDHVASPARAGTRRSTSSPCRSTR